MMINALFFSAIIGLATAGPIRVDTLSTRGSGVRPPSLLSYSTNTSQRPLQEPIANAHIPTAEEITGANLGGNLGVGGAALVGAAVGGPLGLAVPAAKEAFNAVGGLANAVTGTVTGKLQENQRVDRERNPSEGDVQKLQESGAKKDQERLAGLEKEAARKETNAGPSDEPGPVTIPGFE